MVGAPAQTLGLAFIWTHRYNEMNETAVQPLVEFRDFGSPADWARNG